jgi:hypothetical protein
MLIIINIVETTVVNKQEFCASSWRSTKVRQYIVHSFRYLKRLFHHIKPKVQKQTDFT